MHRYLKSVTLNNLILTVYKAGRCRLYKPFRINSRSHDIKTNIDRLLVLLMLRRTQPMRNGQREREQEREGRRFCRIDSLQMQWFYVILIPKEVRKIEDLRRVS